MRLIDADLRALTKEPTGKRAEEINMFFNNVERPVVVQDSIESHLMDKKQFQALGKVLMLSSLDLALLPNPLWGKMLFILMALIVGFIGGLLLKEASRQDMLIQKLAVNR